jgi:hypothetical protein
MQERERGPCNNRGRRPLVRTELAVSCMDGGSGGNSGGASAAVTVLRA